MRSDSNNTTGGKLIYSRRLIWSRRASLNETIEGDGLSQPPPPTPLFPVAMARAAEPYVCLLFLCSLAPLKANTFGSIQRRHIKLSRRAH